MTNFFFINSYDTISSACVSTLVNCFPDVKCQLSFTDYFMPDLFQPENDYVDVKLDYFIQAHTAPEIKFNGNIQRFTSFELQYKTIKERTKTPYRKINIFTEPKDKINYILYSWLNKGYDADFILKHLQTQLKLHIENEHPLIVLYQFMNVHNYVLEAANKLAPTRSRSAENELFLYALAKVICYESINTPLPSKNYELKKIVSEKDSLKDMVAYLTLNKNPNLSADASARLNKKMLQTQNFLQRIKSPVWSTWQDTLLQECMESRFRTIYYPHIDKSLSTLYKEKNYGEYNKAKLHTTYSKLISIQLNSNRPAQLSAYFDNIEETTADLNNIEVLINIDQGDQAMEALLTQEIARRNFCIKYLSTPRPKSFCDLWKPINTLLTIRDPNCYFMLNISDEMFFTEYGWDKVLEKYVGFFPDDLFRLRASRNKFRVQYDRWECSFAQDCIPITTRRWIEVGGDWNPCFGPDSFQQLISFYLTKDGMFSNEHYSRDVPIVDINFAGDVPAVGIAPEKQRKHISDHIYAMEICQSYKMQLEANKRAMKIKANILAYKNQIKDFHLSENTKNKTINLMDNNDNRAIATLNYQLNWYSITLTNLYRRIRFFNYFGDGLKNKNSLIKGFIRYLVLKYHNIYSFILLAKKRPTKKKSIKILLQENQRISELYSLSKLKNEKHYFSELESDLLKQFENRPD